MTVKEQKIDALAYSKEIAQSLKKGAFLTTKKGDKVNSMVIGWGHIGRIWERPVFVAYVRISRYTRELLDANPEFTVNVPIHGFTRKAFEICGSKSGRDMDKMHDSVLTARETDHSMTFGEAEVTLLCRKLFCQELQTENMRPEIATAFYSVDAKHDMYIGEIIEIIRQ